MPNVDELGRQAAAALRRDVRVDVESGLRRLHASTPAPQRRGRRWAVVGAAAVVLLAVAAFVVIDRTPARHSPATTPATATTTSIEPTPNTTVAPPTTSTAPPTTATTAADTTPATTAAATTAPPTSSAPVVAPPSTDLAVFAAPPTIELPPMLIDLPLSGCDPSCPSVVGTGDGTLVAFDAGAQSLQVLPLGATEATVVPLRDPGWTGGWIVAVGPGDIAYLFGHAADVMADEAQDLVAIPLTGPSAGTIVARTPGVGDISGDTEYEPTASGIVAVSCCSNDRVRPDPAKRPTMAWVDADGRAVTGASTYLTATFEPRYVVVERSDSNVPFEVTAAFVDDIVRGMPELAAEADGGVLVATASTNGPGWRFLRARPDGSVELFGGLADGQYLLALDPSGPIVATGTGIARWQLPGYGGPTSFEATELTGAASFASSDEAAEAVLATLRSPNGCEVVPTARLTGTEARTDRVIARFEVRESCDDSIAGRAIAVELRPGADGRWTAAAAVAAPLCRRGVTDGACV